MPIKPLSFKGDKKPSKKRKHHESSLTSSDAPITSGSLTAAPSAQPEEGDDDSWATPTQPSDLSGPLLLVLPTHPPTSLASDSNGRVFASPLENIIEGDPRTAEPHDVRQVWVAQKVAGMGEGHLGFKGAHGGWLSCDSLGVLGASREARGIEEGFIVERIPDDEAERNQNADTNQDDHGDDEDDNDAQHASTKRRKILGSWRIQTAATKKSEGDKGRRYLCAVVNTTTNKFLKSTSKNNNDADAKEDDSIDTRPKTLSLSLRGDAEQSDPQSRLIIRMQARFMPRSTTSQAAQRAKEKISRKELEVAVGRPLEDHEVKRLKRARREGGYHEEVLDMRAKGKHDKFA